MKITKIEKKKRLQQNSYFLGSLRYSTNGSIILLFTTSTKSVANSIARTIPMVANSNPAFWSQLLIQALTRSSDNSRLSTLLWSLISHIMDIVNFKAVSR